MAHGDKEIHMNDPYTQYNDGDYADDDSDDDYYHFAHKNIRQ